MATIFEKFPKVSIAYYLNILWVENFDKMALSQMVKEIEAFLCFCIFAQNSKIQNSRHFGKEEICFENWYCSGHITTLLI